MLSRATLTFSFAAAFTVAIPSLFSENVLVRMPEGSAFFLELPKETTARNVLHQIEGASGIPSSQLLLIADGRVMNTKEAVTTHDTQEFWVHLKSEEFGEESLIPKKTHVGYRNYYQAIRESEKKDIKFILKTLAQKSLTSLWGYKSQLEYAGDRIDHLHPLKFLEYIFSDEELKVYIANIRKRSSWIWGEFAKGFKDSFQEERQIGNLKDEFLNDFVKNVGIDISLIHDVFKAGRWEDFIKILIINVPRSGDSGRYDQ